MNYMLCNCFIPEYMSLIYNRLLKSHKKLKQSYMYLQFFTRQVFNLAIQNAHLARQDCCLVRGDVNLLLSCPV